MEREEKTFNVVPKGVSGHFIVQFEHTLDAQSLARISRVSADSRLTKSDEKGGFHW